MLRWSRTGVRVEAEPGASQAGLRLALHTEQMNSILVSGCAVANGPPRVVLRARICAASGRPAFTVPAVLSLLVFFALCCQCSSTVAVIRCETHSWRWPALTFTYMTALAYAAAPAVYQVASRIA